MMFKGVWLCKATVHHVSKGADATIIRAMAGLDGEGN